ncbi:Dihydrodipicolinate synthase [Devosia sp. LC5]|uniref:dihydrodipicolinate synthase family protein n=1 Tax=Devosia sp. LC5 TaxID=1502724 RepID=UPI0004E37BB2|nr:dihydrodipicolinate synthase family protein [Devosia sp. LC5]KFC69530.1 Dihydrodipicolinate synthase [Devosia sp. LC5]
MLLGVLPVLPTPFAAEGGVDPAAMARVTAFALDAGADGVVFPGVASEFDYLGADERQMLVEVVGRTLAGRKPFIVGASAATPAEVIAFCRSGKAAGASAAMVMAPASVGSDLAALIAFFSAVAADGGLDLILQNAPAPVGSGLPVATIAEVVKAVPAIRYVKEETLPSGPRITALIEATGDRLAGVMGGGGSRYVLDELQRGAVALMPAVEIADLHADLFRAFTDGHIERARELYIRSLPILLVQMIYRMALTKEVLVRRGVFTSATVRAPLPAFDAQGRAEIDMMLAEIADLLTVVPAETLRAVGEAR